MNRGNQVLLALLLAMLGQQAQAQAAKHATLSITVQKKVYSDEAPRPMQGVGTFDLTRGANKMEGAVCPDYSGPTGQVRCTIPCKSTDESGMIIRVRAPSDQDLLVGLIAPAPVDVEVKRCAVKPSAITMLYQDAKQVLDILLAKKFAWASGGGGSGGGGAPPGTAWIEEIKRNPSTMKMVASSASSPEGRADLIEIHRYATLAAAIPALQVPNQSPQNKALAEALAEWQILTKSTLLEAKVAQVFPQRSSWGNMKLGPTTDLSSYRALLANADDFVAKWPNKSGDELRLVDDIKTLKATPSTGKDAVAAMKVLEGWK